MELASAVLRENLHHALSSAGCFFVARAFAWQSLVVFWSPPENKNEGYSWWNQLPLLFFPVLSSLPLVRSDMEAWLGYRSLNEKMQRKVI